MARPKVFRAWVALREDAWDVERVKWTAEEEAMLSEDALDAEVMSAFSLGPGKQSKKRGATDPTTAESTSGAPLAGTVIQSGDATPSTPRTDTRSFDLCSSIADVVVVPPARLDTEARSTSSPLASGRPLIGPPLSSPSATSPPPRPPITLSPTRIQRSPGLSTISLPPTRRSQPRNPPPQSPSSRSISPPPHPPISLSPTWRSRPLISRPRSRATSLSASRSSLAQSPPPRSSISLSPTGRSPPPSPPPRPPSSRPASSLSVDSQPRCSRLASAPVLSLVRGDDGPTTATGGVTSPMKGRSSIRALTGTRSPTPSTGGVESADLGRHSSPHCPHGTFVAEEDARQSRMEEDSVASDTSASQPSSVTERLDRMFLKRAELAIVEDRIASEREGTFEKYHLEKLAQELRRQLRRRYDAGVAMGRWSRRFLGGTISLDGKTPEDTESIIEEKLENVLSPDTNFIWFSFKLDPARRSGDNWLGQKTRIRSIFQKYDLSAYLAEAEGDDRLMTVDVPGKAFKSWILSYGERAGLELCNVVA